MTDVAHFLDLWWVKRHQLSEHEQGRITRVAEDFGGTFDDFRRELRNVLARREIDKRQLDPRKSLAVGKYYRAKHPERFPTDEPEAKDTQ